MIHLVGYSDSSSEDDDNKAIHCCEGDTRFSSDLGSKIEKDGEDCDCEDTGRVRDIRPVMAGQQQTQLIEDLPITDESDGDQNNDFIGSPPNSELLVCKQQSNVASSLRLIHHEKHQKPFHESQINGSIHSHSQGYHLFSCENVFPQDVHSETKVIKVVDDITYSSHTPVLQEGGIHPLSETTDKKLQTQQSHFLNLCKDAPVILNKTNINNSSAIISKNENIFLQGNHNFTEAALQAQDVVQSFEADNHPTSKLNRKRKLTSVSDNQLPVPDAIHSMYHGSQQRWIDDPALHDNRVRSFPHLEGNWATHVFIHVPKNDLFVRFVDHLLELLIPQTFQMQQDFHISLSRTVAIRYHWIEPLIDSLRDNLKDLKSCISDLTDVKLFINEEKTRTFVSIELSQDETEFMDYVKAVDKSFAEFKLPAYYEKPSIHISVGWCVGDVVAMISDEKLCEARELLGEFVATSPMLSFVYAHEICCQSGCKSFVMTLKDSDK